MTSPEKILVKQLSPTMLALGFKWVRGREKYIRKETYGFSSLSWASYPTPTDGGRLELIPILGVRHDAVENLVNQLGLIYDDEGKRYTTTVSRGLGYFPFQAGKDYTQYIRMASIETDVMRVATNLADIVAGEGKAFYERYSSLLECSQGLNIPIASRPHPLCNNFPKRAYYGIVVAWFAEIDRVPQLVNQYLNYSKDVLPNQYEEIAERINQLVYLMNNESHAPSR